MSSNIIGPLPKESDNQSEKVRKKWGFGIYKKRHWSLLLTRLSKKGILTWLTKKKKTEPNLVKEAITPPISAKKKIYTVNKTEKSKACNKTVDTPKIYKTDKFKSIDKSKCTQRTDTENTVDK